MENGKWNMENVTDGRDWLSEVEGIGAHDILA
jgi:hypothetical protein